jgi:hypothetical protein
MKIDIKSKGGNIKVEFLITPGQGDNHFTALARSSNDLDNLQLAISDSGAGDDMVSVVIAKAMEKKLKLPIDVNHSYQGAGYGFKFDLYSISKKLK